ncbi:MAG: tRNA (adenosine(37)-N6)-dimethylallyltransferase MiaA, partial [Candidatus Symbiothrix sp.]|nr:tRNA (adenosine(37)-N6)-dimethylallyltransferase MiaA [Candidatus Symbiothrix sp.]
TGLYIEAVLNGYKLLDVPENPELRNRLKDKSLPELEVLLKSYKTLHNKTEVDSAQRAIRAIEIEEYYRNNDLQQRDYPPINSLIIGTEVDRETRRQRISARLQSRLDKGMLDEIRELLKTVSTEDLMYYGLEYKYLTLHVTGKLSYREMFDQLEIAIHQFAKRQMTWFRGMERRGFTIHWIDPNNPDSVQKILQLADFFTTFADL